MPSAAVSRVKNPFKPAADSVASDPADRLAQLRELPPDDPATDERLETAARSDDSLDVRRGAVGSIGAAPRLFTLFTDAELRPVLGDVIRARLAERFEVDAVDDNTAQSFLAADPVTLAPLIAARARGERLRADALQRIDDDAELLRVVQDSGFHDARLAAAQRLQAEPMVREALQAARSRDKVVARLLQQRLDDAAQRQSRQQAAEQERDETLAALEQLAGSVWSPQHAGRLSVLRERWAGLDSALTDALAARAEAAIRAIEAVNAEHVEPAAQTPSQEAGATPAASDTAEPSEPSEGLAQDAAAAPSAPVYAPLEPAAAAFIQAIGEPTLETLASVPATAEGEQAKALDAHRQAVGVLFDPPFALAGSRPAAVRERLARVDALLDAERVLPGIDPALLPWFAELQAHHASLAQRLSQAEQESSDRLKATVRQFGALSGLIKEGKWAPASSLFRRIEKKIDAMEDRERRELGDRLERARKQLAEMADWQDFASRPKLEEVVTRMEALAAADDVKPPARARQVRELQAEWKSLGAGRASNELWPRFKTAADAAYEPCKAFFEERAKEREQKRAERLAVVEELEAAAAEASPGPDTPVDPRALQSRVSRARQAWSRTRVQDRKPDKALEARFTAALKPFESVLVEEYKKNEAEKQALVERMTELAAGEIDQHTANRAKSLQSAWKLVGVTRRKQDQALWEAFNEQARTVFAARRDASREQQKAELAHVYRGRAIVDELKKLARQGTADEATVQSLSSEFDALAEFPERDRKGLIRAYRDALDGVSRLREQGARRRAQAGREELQRLVGLCERVERAVEALGDGPDSGENPLTLREEVIDAWSNGGGDAVPPREPARALESRRDAALAHLAGGTQPDWAAAEEQRRDLLIRLEVAADVETPSEDRSRRMRFQLENLQEGMTSAGVADKRATLAALEQQWLAAPGAPSAVAAALESRYLKAMGR